MAVTLPATVLRRYPRFSRFNSPYTAHDRGCAVDCYPDDPENDAPSPVAGEVVATRTVDAPPKPYATAHDHLIVIDLAPDSPGAADAALARILHVDPAVEAGDRISVGDSLGTLVRSGFFAPWVANHIHLGFRGADADPLRASGSLPISLPADLDVRPVPWDGTGTVVETGETYALLDAPEHPAAEEQFAGIAGVVDDSDGDRREPTEYVVLDGGMTHYAGGGALGRSHEAASTVSFLGHPVGDVAGRDVTWRGVDVLANGERITGISLFTGVDPRFGAKLVCPDREFAVGETVRVTVRDSDDPIRLG